MEASDVLARYQEPLQQLRVRCTSAWVGHEAFALWLVQTLEPETVVDLGVDYGFSTFVWALPGIGRVYGIDWFQGDPQTQLRDTQTAVQETHAWLRAEHGVDNVEIIRDSFEHAAGGWDRPIDILGIDGFHSYEAVRRDLRSWSPHLRHGGVIVLHDITVQHPGFGVHQLWQELPPPKAQFEHSSGLGVLSADQTLLQSMAAAFPSLTVFDEE